MDADTNDLLSLIGNSIENLSQCIALFDQAQPSDGVKKLSSVVTQIEAYLQEIDADPILRLASVDRGEIEVRLQSIETDVTTIISDLGDKEHEHMAQQA